MITREAYKMIIWREMAFGGQMKGFMARKAGRTHCWNCSISRDGALGPFAAYGRIVSSDGELLGKNRN
jgi:hypothetical protein